MKTAREIAHDQICQAVRLLREDASDQPKAVRSLITRFADNALRELLPKIPGPSGRFSTYLKRQSNSSLWDSEGDDHHSGEYYRIGAASCFFPMAARELIEDGIDPANVAMFCIEAAYDALQRGGYSQKEIEDKLSKFALRFHVDDEPSGSSPMSGGHDHLTSESDPQLTNPQGPPGMNGAAASALPPLGLDGDFPPPAAGEGREIASSPDPDGRLRE